MAIPTPARNNFQTLLEAAKNNRLALMECKDAKTQQTVYVICGVNSETDGSIAMVPFGHLATGNPYEDYVSPINAETDISNEPRNEHPHARIN